MRPFQLLFRVHSGALVALVLVTACRTAETGGPAQPVAADANRLQRDIAWLADDRREGRGTGTPGNDSAAAYIARRHEALGLQQVVPGTYLQKFTARSEEMAHDGHPEGVAAQNVVAMVPGTDAVLRNEYVVIGAHFDHLGRSSAHSSDPEAGNAIRNGADDNASGITAANVEPKLVVSAVGDGFGPSDHSSFYTKGIPVLHFFTDLHDDYHKATDDAPKINAVGEARVVGLAERVVRTIADRPSRLDVVRSVAPVASAGSREGSSTYFGSIPDMSAGDIPGLKLSSVRAGSPAAVGGLEMGDVIVSFGGKPVTDLYSYTDALYAHKPGDTVDVTYLRRGERRTTMVTLGRRGQ
ncbi:MAG: M28 family peptidase [bacterium]